MDKEAIHQFIDSFLATEKAQDDVAAAMKEIADRTKADGSIEVSIGDNKFTFSLPASVLTDHFNEKQIEVQTDLDTLTAPLATLPALPMKALNHG